jgi:murein DD-endopeptidase MepM/ murein hydrolase activator NlpD
MRKILRERNLTLPYLVVFCYMFLPMLFISNVEQNIPRSGSSAGERVVSGEPSVFDIESAHAFQAPKRAPFIVRSNYQNEIERPNYLNYSNAVLPVDDPEISSDFGWRVAPCDACSSDHQGVDFVPGAGKPVKAILNGIVSEAGVNQGYGYWVKIEHIVPITDDEVERWETIYAHLQADSIPEDVLIGANVKRGQVIGAVGSTGISTGPHLHFELHIDGEVTDPLPIISQSQVIKDLEVFWK